MRLASLVILCAGACAAQEREPSELRFARALAARGWPELAAVALDDALGAGRRQAFDAAWLLRADVAVDEAIATVDSAARAARLDAAVSRYDGLARTAAKDVAVDARLHACEAWLRAGDSAGAASRPDEARALYTRAERRGHELVDTFRSEADHLGSCEPIEPDPARAEEEVREAIYLLSQASLLEARAVHRAARLLPQGAERESQLERAARAFQQVGFDYADQPSAYEAGIELGQLERDCGRREEAVRAFQSAADILKNFGDSPEAAAKEPFFADIAKRAMLLRTQVLRELGREEAASASQQEYDALFGPGR